MFLSLVANKENSFILWVTIKHNGFEGALDGPSRAVSVCAVESQRCSSIIVLCCPRAASTNSRPLVDPLVGGGGFAEAALCNSSAPAY